MVRPDFERALRKGTWRRILSFVTGHPSLLLPFDLVREKVGIKSSSYSGIREIEIAKVIGSVNRYHEFDREFLPRQWQTAERWNRVRQSFEEGPGFSPIKVYQVGEAYFVVDGNHRVSVAKQLGMKRIEAEITRFEPKVPIDEHTDVRSLIVKAEYSDFLRATGLDTGRPEQRIEFTRPGRYAVLLEHIEKHRYFKSLDEGEGDLERRGGRLVVRQRLRAVGRDLPCRRDSRGVPEANRGRPVRLDLEAPVPSP